MNLSFGRYKLSLGLNALITIVTSVLIIIFLLVGFLVLQPKFKELGEIRKNIVQKETEIELNQNYFVKLKDTKTELDKYQGELSKIDSALPDNPLVPDFFGFLQGVASQSGLLLERSGSFTTALSPRFSVLQETSFSLGVAGSYSAFKTFLTSLEKDR